MRYRFISYFLRLSLAAVVVAGCEELLGPAAGEAGCGVITWSFAPGGINAGMETRGESFSIPDTNAFLLTITSSAGKVLYDGTYGASPTSIMADPGSYTVSVKSEEFAVPAFSRPQFGAEEVVVVKKGETSRAVLHCTQINAGIRLKVAPSFTSAYPSASLKVKSADGSLPYPASETRVAYFKPGAVTVQKSDSGGDETLFSRNIPAQHILTVTISASASGGGGMSLQVDTARVWTGEEFKIGGGNDGGTVSSAISAADVASHAGETAVWVYGFIVGGDLSSSGSRMNTEPPFSSDTHMAISYRSSVTEKASCVSVELKKGDLRDQLNLVSHPDNLGRQVFLKGDIVSSYYGLPGLKNITEWILR